MTPLDTYQGVGLAVLPAAIVGLLLVGLSGQLATKYVQSKRRGEEAKADMRSVIKSPQSRLYPASLRCLCCHFFF